MKTSRSSKYAVTVLSEREKVQLLEQVKRLKDAMVATNLTSVTDALFH